MRLDAEGVLSKLDVKLRAPTPPGPPLALSDPRVSITAKTLLERTLSESDLQFIETRMSSYCSPTSLAHVVDYLTECEKPLFSSKQRRTKKTRVRQGGSLPAQDAQDIPDQTLLDEQIKREMQQHRSLSQEGLPRERRCGNCGKTGHNARTCQEDIEMSNVYGAEQM